MKYHTSEFRNGLKVELDGSPYVMVYFQFVKPGKGTAFTRTKLKNMLNGNVIERTFRTGETVDAADVAGVAFAVAVGVAAAFAVAVVLTVVVAVAVAVAAVVVATACGAA